MKRPQLPAAPVRKTFLLRVHRSASVLRHLGVGRQENERADDVHPREDDVGSGRQLAAVALNAADGHPLPEGDPSLTATLVRREST
jgi:hypothetical protein